MAQTWYVFEKKKCSNYGIRKVRSTSFKKCEYAVMCDLQALVKFGRHRTCQTKTSGKSPKTHCFMSRPISGVPSRYVGQYLHDSCLRFSVTKDETVSRQTVFRRLKETDCSITKRHAIYILPRCTWIQWNKIINYICLQCWILNVKIGHTTSREK